MRFRRFLARTTLAAAAIGSIAGVGLLLLVLAGCSKAGVKVDQSSLDYFQVGVTTHTEVRQALGTPTLSIVNSDGTKQFVYEYTQREDKWISYIPYANLFSSGTSTESTSVTFDFDRTGILLGYRSAQGQMGYGAGFIGGARPK